MAGKISELDAAVSVADADQVEVLQGGANKRAASILFVTAAKIATALGLTASRAMVTNGSGAVAASSVTATELGYVSGVTSAIQTQLNTKPDTGAEVVALFTGTPDGTKFLRDDGTLVTPAGGGSIDGSGTAGRGARWTDSDTLGDAAVQDDGTKVGIGAAPAADASLTIKAQADDACNLSIEGTGGVIVPTVRMKHSSDTNGVTIKGDDTGFSFANGGEGTTLVVKPGFPEAYVKTHVSSTGRLNFQTHDGSDFVTVLALKAGKMQFWDGSALLDVEPGANDSGGTGKRALVVDNS